MTSAARIKANRENAKRSTGPQSLEGKMRSSLNSMKHALLARISSLPEFERMEFASLLRALEEYWQPVGTMEAMFVADIAIGRFQGQRALQLECELFARGGPAAEDSHDAVLLSTQFVNGSPMLERVGRYWTSADRRASRAVGRLLAMQQARGRLDVPSSTPDFDTTDPSPQGPEGPDRDEDVDRTIARAAGGSLSAAPVNENNPEEPTAVLAEATSVADVAVCQTDPTAGG